MAVLHNGNCLDILKTIPDESVDFVITDPPYNIGFDSSEATHEFDEAWDHKSNEEFINFNKAWLDEIYRIVKPGGSAICFMGPTQIPTFFDTIDKTQWLNDLENWEILYRQKGRGSNHKLKSLSEDIIHLTKNEIYYMNSSEYKERIIDWGKQMKNPLGWVVNVDTAERVEYTGEGDMECFTQPYYLSTTQKQIHPCQKAVPMLAKFIMKYCPKDGTVLDCFMGSGSSGVAALASNRKYIGIEQDKNMFDKAKEWIENYDVGKLIKNKTFRFGGIK